MTFIGIYEIPEDDLTSAPEDRRLERIGLYDLEAEEWDPDTTEGTLLMREPQEKTLEAFKREFDSPHVFAERPEDVTGDVSISEPGVTLEDARKKLAKRRDNS